MNRYFLFLVLFVYLLTSCVTTATPSPISQDSSTKTPSPTKTFIPSTTPTILSSSTPVRCFKTNSALSEYEWCPEHILIRYDSSFGDGGDDFVAPPPPSLILYSDGSLFLTHSEQIYDDYRTRILFKKLDRKEICQHLNTFEEVGYFDYDPLSYGFIGDGPAVKGAPGSITLEVNGWRSHQGSYYELGFFLQDELTGEFAKDMQLDDIEPSQRNGWPIIAPELRSAYYFLDEYPLVDFEIYQPERLGVWLMPLDQKFVSNYKDPIKWNINNPSLSAMLEDIDVSGKSSDLYTILIGEEARIVYDFLEQSYTSGLFYEENSNGEKEYYLLLERPLLPYELPEAYISQIPDPNIEKPNFKLVCYLSDGILPIPTPSLP